MLARAERFAGGGRQQRLAPARKGHHPGRDRLGQAFDLERLRAARDVVGRVLSQDHRSDVQAGARRDRSRQRRQGSVVRHRVADRVCAVVEQQQHAVGLVDLAPVPGPEQRARDSVVRCPDLGHRAVAELLGQAGAVHDVRQQQGLDRTHFAVGRCSLVNREAFVMAASLPMALQLQRRRMSIATYV